MCNDYLTVGVILLGGYKRIGGRGGGHGFCGGGNTLLRGDVVGVWWYRTLTLRWLGVVWNVGDYPQVEGYRIIQQLVAWLQWVTWWTSWGTEMPWTG